MSKAEPGRLFDAFALDLVALVIALTAGGGIMTETEMKPR